MRVPGEGLPELRVDRRGQPVSSARRGDLRVLVVLETPRNLSKRHEELFREMAEIEHKDVSAPRKTFLDKVKGWFGSPADVKK